jgi:hypothetical protein
MIRLQKDCWCPNHKVAHVSHASKNDIQIPRSAAVGRLFDLRTEAARRGVLVFLLPSPFLPHTPKSRHSAWPTQVADHLVPNQVLGFFEFFRERERGRFLFSKACKSLYRRRFKEVEDAPFAASGFAHIRGRIIMVFRRN